MSELNKNSESSLYIKEGLSFETLLSHFKWFVNNAPLMDKKEIIKELNEWLSYGEEIANGGSPEVDNPVAQAEIYLNQYSKALDYKEWNKGFKEGARRFANWLKDNKARETANRESLGIMIQSKLQQ